MPTIPFLADVPEVAHLEDVRQRVAEELPDEAQLFRAGICNSDGRVVAAAMFSGFDQICKFSSELEEFGYRCLILGDEDEMQGCDVIFVKLHLPDGEVQE